MSAFDLIGTDSDAFAGSNEIGFGWTNAAFLELLADLPPASRTDVLRLDGVGTGDRRVAR